jgi:hypothetical protein
MSIGSPPPRGTCSPRLGRKRSQFLAFKTYPKAQQNPLFSSVFRLGGRLCGTARNTLKFTETCSEHFESVTQNWHRDVPGAFVVAGFYTPDYEHWFYRLERSLIEHGAPYDFEAVPKEPGGWEANTRRKAGLILDAMHRHSGKTLIWIDVDALCVGDVSQLVGLPCDVAIRLHGWRTRHRVSLMARAGTIIFNPTENARRLVQAWAAEADCAQYGDHDEISLTLAVGSIKGLVLMNLGEIGLKVIEHDNASASAKKIKRWDRRRHWVWSKMPVWITGNWTEPEEDTGLRFPPRK